MNLQRYRSEALEKAIEVKKELVVLTLAPNVNLVDGLKFEKKPDVIVVSSKNTHTQPIHFSNVSDAIIVAEGHVNLVMGPNFAYVVKFSNCNRCLLTGDLHLSGGKQDPSQGSIGISIGAKSSDIEMAGLEIFGVGFAGIMAKDDSAFFGEYVMRNISIHDCVIHHTGGEGAYIGNSSLINQDNGKRNHATENVHIFNNHFHDNKWDPIQSGCGINTKIFGNLIEDFGLANKPGQRNGIQIGVGTNGEVYDNTVARGRGNGIIVLGSGVTVRKNRVYYADESSIFADVRDGTVAGHKFIDNELLHAKTFGLACRVTRSEAIDNTILHAGLRSFERTDTLTQTNNYPDNISNLAEYLMKKGA